MMEMVTSDVDIDDDDHDGREAETEPTKSWVYHEQGMKVFLMTTMMGCWCLYFSFSPLY